MNEERILRNKHGDIRVGTRVFFMVENQNQWNGGNSGILEHDGTNFVIETPKGIVTIGRGYDAYRETVRPLKSRNK